MRDEKKQLQDEPNKGVSRRSHIGSVLGGIYRDLILCDHARKYFSVHIYIPYSGYNNFEGINFRFRKVFADLIFVELGLFAACMHACNIKFAVLMFAVHA